MSAYQEQKRTKPPIDVLAQAYLTGETQAKLLAFVAFLRENRMTPQWGSTNSYNLSFKNRRVCIIKIEKDSYQLWLNTQYNDDFDACFREEDEETRQYLRDRIQYCWGCGGCKPGIDREILGVACKGACFNPVLRMTCPDEKQLELARHLVLLRRAAIREGKAPRVTYMAASKRV